MITAEFSLRKFIFFFPYDIKTWYTEDLYSLAISLIHNWKFFGPTACRSNFSLSCLSPDNAKHDAQICFSPWILFSFPFSKTKCCELNVIFAPLCTSYGQTLPFLLFQDPMDDVMHSLLISTVSLSNCFTSLDDMKLFEHSLIPRSWKAKKPFSDEWLLEKAQQFTEKQC